MKLNPDVFFVIDDGRLIAWNYRAHEQFEISGDHFRVLIDPAFAGERPELVEELEEGALLVADDAESASWGWDPLARIFHVGTSTTGPASAPLSDHRELGNAAEKQVRIAPLRRGEHAVSTTGRTPPARVAELTRALAHRHTTRTPHAEAVALDDLALILSESFRYRDRATDESIGVDVPAQRRSSPSAGGLQACEAYVVARNVTGLAPGVYHYWSDEDALGHLAELPEDLDLRSMLWGQAAAEALAVLVVVTCRFPVLWSRFRHSRAYRMALLDSGHLSQTVQLLAEGLGLETWSSSTFRDHELAALLGLPVRDPTEAPLFVIGLAGAP